LRVHGLAPTIQATGEAELAIAFAHLVDHYPASLRRVARLYISNRAVADEVMQDTWLGVIQGMWAFEGRSSLKTWIFRILIKGIDSFTVTSLHLAKKFRLAFGCG